MVFFLLVVEHLQPRWVANSIFPKNGRKTKNVVKKRKFLWNNFNKDAYERLEFFDNLVKEQLVFSALIHVDETGINTGGIRSWLHNASNDKYSYFYPHINRGGKALDEMGVSPMTSEILRIRYRDLLHAAENECSAPDTPVVFYD
jgi:hypothetical protein